MGTSVSPCPKGAVSAYAVRMAARCERNKNIENTKRRQSIVQSPAPRPSRDSPVSHGSPHRACLALPGQRQT